MVKSPIIVVVMSLTTRRVKVELEVVHGNLLGDDCLYLFSAWS